MSKTDLKNDILDSLRSLTQNLQVCVSIAGDLHRLADNLQAYIQESGDEPPTAGLQPEKLTLEQVRAVLAEKSRSGHTAEIRSLLEAHGVTKLSEIDPAEYAALLLEAEVLGNG